MQFALDGYSATKLFKESDILITNDVELAKADHGNRTVILLRMPDSPEMTIPSVNNVNFHFIDVEGKGFNAFVEARQILDVRFKRTQEATAPV